MGRRSQVLLVRRRFWELIAEGMSSEDAAAAVGVVGTTGSRWFCRFGGVNPRIKAPQGCRRPRLTDDEREQIMIGTSVGESIRSIARRLGRHPARTAARRTDTSFDTHPNAVDDSA